MSTTSPMGALLARVFHIHAAAHHALDDFIVGKIFGQSRFDHFAVAQNGSVVRQTEHFVQLVGNINEGDALRLEFFNDFKQALRFLRGQGRGRLVHHHQTGVVGKRLGNFHQLALRGGKVFNFFRGAEAEAKAIQQGLRLRVNGTPIHVAAALLQAVDVNVFRYGKRVDEVEFLENQAQALLARIHRIANAGFFHRSSKFRLRPPGTRR